MLKKLKKFDKKYFIELFIIMSAASFLLFTVLPMYVYYLNSSEINWEVGFWFSLFLVATLLSIFIAFTVSYLNSTLKKVFFVTVLGVFIYILIRAFFLPVDFGFLDGVVKPERENYFSDKSIWATFFIVTVAFFFAWKNLKTCIDIVKLSTLASMLFVVYSAINFYYQQPNSNVMLSLDADSKSLSRFSNKENIIVISFDSLQNDLFIDSLLNNTHFNEVLNGFSVYTDVISYAPNTIWSLLSTLTGKHIETNAEGEQREGLVEKYKNNTITSVLSMHGYQVDTFNIIDSMGGDNIINNNTHRVLPIEFVEATQPGAYYVAMLRILPKTLSKRLVDGISRILDKLGEKLGLHVILTDKLGRFFGSDIYAFRKMYGEAYLVNEPVFKFHHYLFTHQPIRLDADCSYLANTQQSFKAAQAELTCVLDEFSNFIVKLKKMGIYDQSLIILTSDHGYESNIQPSRWNGKTYKGGYTNENGLWSASRYWTVLAMKPMGANNTLYFDPQPASLLDIVPTIAGFANIGFCHRVECDGNDLLSRSDPENSDRKAMFFIGGRRHIPDVHFDTRVFQTLTIQGDAYTGIKEAMESISDDS